MGKKQQFYGVDVLKFLMALLVAGRHMVQVCYPADSPWRLIVGSWLSNLAVPVFFTAAGFLLFKKVEEKRRAGASGTGTVLVYCWRIFKLYVLWSILYWPVDIYNWYHGSVGIRETVKQYIRSFFFSSSIVHLWYLPALLTACLLVWALRRAGLKVWQLLIVTGVLFVIGCIGDNWFFNQKLPPDILAGLYRYVDYFMSMRNGVFYGSFYVAMGMLLAGKKRRLSPLLSAAGVVLSGWAMRWEVIHCFNVNMVFFAAPTAYFLMELALSARFKDRLLYLRLRGMSQWIYFIHLYLLYFVSWSWQFHGLPRTELNALLLLFVPLLAISWGLTALSDVEGCEWLKRMI
ncbi:MAG: acyltransferase [Eubacteriales bacterium]|nr:acyltransferase [Eubacteriales bacterium]